MKTFEAHLTSLKYLPQQMSNIDRDLLQTVNIYKPTIINTYVHSKLSYRDNKHAVA
jgi:hypothetical protein